MAEAAASRGRLPVPRHRLPDYQLISLALGGDTSAFAAIYSRYAEALYRYCVSLVRHQEDARDVVQATMLSALQATAAGRPVDSLKPWLYRIAHNEAISLLRRSRIEEAVGEDLPVDSLETRGPGGRDRLLDLFADVRDLSDRQRAALMMRELSGFNYDYIALNLGISAAAARRSVSDARAALSQAEAGRAMECGAVRRQLAARDGRCLRARKLRAHLRDCVCCRDYERSLNV